MGIFGKKKKKASEEGIPDSSEFPLKAYVYRLLPEKVGKKQVAGRLSGDFDGFTSAQDLEDMVAKIHGGGTYRCKVVKSKETKTHIGYHNFVIPGAPMLNGTEISEDEPEKTSAKHAGTDAVQKIERDIQIEEAQAKLDEAKAQRARKQKSLGMLDDDDDDDDAAQTVGMPGMEDQRVVQMSLQMKALEKRLEDKDREMERDRHRTELAQLKADMDRKFDSIVLQSKSTSGGDMMAAQMKAIESVVNAGQSQTAAMLASNSELIKVMMSRDPSSGINDRVDRLVEKLIDTKSSIGKEQMETMKEAFQTGIMMAKGGEASPTSLADVAREFSGRLLDVVGEFIRQKGAMSKEVLAQEIQKATGSVIAQVKRQMVPMAQRPRVLPPGGMAAEPEPAQVPQARQSNLSSEELRNRVDKIMIAFLNDVQNNTEEWKEVARAQIPPEDLATMGEFTFDNVAQYAMRYGSPDVVQRVIGKLQEAGVFTAEQAAMICAAYNIPLPDQSGMVGPEVSAPSESDDEVLADDDDDDALIGDEEPLAPQVAATEG